MTPTRPHTHTDDTIALVTRSLDYLVNDLRSLRQSSYLSQSLALHQARFCHRHVLRARLVLTVCVLSSPGQNATLRPVPFYCYFVICDCLTVCAGRDPVASSTRSLAGCSPCLPVLPVLVARVFLAQVATAWPSPSLHTYTHHTPSDCYVAFAFQVKRFGFDEHYLRVLVPSSLV